MPLDAGRPVGCLGGCTLWIVAGNPTITNTLLVSALRKRGLRARLTAPAELGRRARTGDVVVGRLDVRPTLDGVEDGLRELRRAEDRGLRVLNTAAALGACHDKLQTVLRLGRLGIPQPKTTYLDWQAPLGRIEFPVVVKPRFGSWGQDVVLCTSEHELGHCLRALRARPWFRRQGALVQTLIPPAGYDLRLVVARGEVVGAIHRVAAPGEWRTNIALGGTRRRVEPPREACRLAVAAAAAVEADLVGVDLLPLGNGGFVVLELNGAVDFTHQYSLAGGDVFDEAARAIESAGLEPELSAPGVELE
jgi:RimK family alpha-L-glutamate ligase